MQVVAICNGNGWVRDADLLKLISDAFGSMGASTICELGFQRLRNKETDGANKNKRVAPKSKWITLIDSGLLRNELDFTELAWEEMNAPRGEHFLPVKNMFHPVIRKQPKELKAVYGPKRSPEWHSPSPGFLVQSAADLELCLRQFTNDNGPLAENWQCLLFTNGMLGRHVREHSANQWFFILGDMAGRAALGWPAKRAFTKSGVV